MILHTDHSIRIGALVVHTGSGQWFIGSLSRDCQHAGDSTERDALPTGPAGIATPFMNLFVDMSRQIGQVVMHDDP